MHLYLDESIAPPVYVQAALVVYDRDSQLAIRRAVTRTIVRLKEHLKQKKPDCIERLPEGRILELKGATQRNKEHACVPGLNNRSELRNDFFQKLVDEANFKIFVLYIDRQELIQEWMPQDEHRKYGRVLQNLISFVELVPPRARFFGITIDSQNTARPTQEGGKLYTWRKRRPTERKHRIGDKARHRRWFKQINAVLRSRYPSAKLKRRIWLVPSHLEPCLQASDVISNFCFRYHRLGLRFPPNHYSPVAGRVAGAKSNKNASDWFEGYRIIAPRVRWIHNPRLRKPKHFKATAGALEKLSSKLP